MKTLALPLLITLTLLGGAPLQAAEEKPDPLYKINYQTKAPVKASASSGCNLTITPKEGWVLKTETPFKALLSATEDIELPQVKFSSKDFVDAKAAPKTILTSFTAKKAGAHSIDASLTFFVCSETICKRQKDAAKCTFEASKTPAP